jgi:hypothetical protein
VRRAIDEAACHHQAVFDQLPDLAVVPKHLEPLVMTRLEVINGRPVYTMCWLDKAEEKHGAWEITVKARAWVPDNCVVVMSHGDTVMEEVDQWMI